MRSSKTADAGMSGLKSAPFGASEAGFSGHARYRVADIVKMALLALAYYVTAVLSLRLALVRGQVTPIWPPTGIALVALLLFGRRLWPGVAVAALLVNVPISPSLLVALGIAAGNTLAPVVAVTLLQRAGFRAELGRLRDALAIVLLGALVGMSISATGGASMLVLSGTVPARTFWPTWMVWWAGDAMGVLVVAPFLLSLRSIRVRPGIGWRRGAEFVALFIAMAAVGNLVFRSPLQVEYLVFPLLGWAAWRFGQRGAAPAALLTSGIAVWAAVKATGPFAHHTLMQKMVTLQVFNATVAFASFVLAALITERRQAEKDLRRSEDQISGLLVSASVGILVIDEAGRIQLANPRAETMFGYDPGELTGMSVEALVPEGRRAAHVDHRAEYLSDPSARPMGLGVDLAGRRKDGKEFPVEIGLSSLGPPGDRLVTCIISDITRRKRAEEAIAFLAYHDKLTGLANSAKFEDHLNLALARARRSGGAVAVLSIDLDDLKLVNDRLGHAAGDEVIAESAARLGAAARQTDLVARQGGDEFLILVADVPPGPADSFGHAVHVAEQVADRIRERFRAPFRLAEADLVVTPSVGISVYPLDARDARSLLRNSDLAMYRSKEAKKARTALPEEEVPAEARSLTSGKGEGSSTRVPRA